MKKINFVNGTTINGAETFNQLQDNIEDVFNGNEAMGSIVVDDIKGTNLFDKNIISDISSDLVYKSIYYGEGTYTMSSLNMPVGNTGTANLFVLANEVTTGADSPQNGVDINTPRIITSTDGYITFAYRSTSYNNTNNPYDYDFMLEKGSVVTDFKHFTKYGYNDKESMGKIVVDDIECKNLFDGNFRTGGFNGANTSGRLFSTQILKLKAGTYTLSSNLDYSKYNISAVTSKNTFPVQNTTDLSYDSQWRTGNITFTISEDGYFGVGIRKSDETTLTLSDIQDNYFQLEKGSVVTNYVEHKEFSNKQIYSTSEQVVGTWIDGKPLYRKTFDLTPQISASVTSTSIDLDIQNVKVAMIDGSHSYMLDNATSTGYMPFPNINSNTAFNGGGYIQVTSGKATLNVRKGSSLTIYKLILTVEYTKTTD